MIINDMYGSRVEAAALTKTATSIIGVLQGKKTSLKDCDRLDIRGMSQQQLNTFMDKLYQSGFSGKLNFN